MPGLRFRSLGSGSAGNALLVEAGRTRVLVDCGFGVAEAGRRLAAIGVEPASVDAILVTHEHDDHVGGVGAFARRHRVPVRLSYGTWRAAERRLAGVTDIDCILPGARFALGDIEVLPVLVPHDAREPVQYVLGDGHVRLGVLTDLGSVSAHVLDRYAGVDGVVLECNHDGRMLRDGPYPASLKERIGGRLGHLSNAAAAALLSAIASDRLQLVVAAHLSDTNNRPELARRALARALAADDADIVVADQAAGCDWFELRRRR